MLTCSDYNADKAMERLIATLKWRDEFNANGTLEESFPDDVFGGLGYVYGKDKQGRPITYAFVFLLSLAIPH